MRQMSADEKRIAAMLVRMFLYVGVLVLVVVAQWKIAACLGSDSMKEDGLVEDLQVGVLVTACLVYSVGAWRIGEWRPLLIGIAALSAACAVRECDYIFDHLIPVISWKFCYLFIIAALIYMWKRREQVRRLLPCFVSSGSFVMLFSVVILIIPAAQCVGHRAFVADAIGLQANEETAILARRALEEPLELVGYVLILLSGIEFYASRLWQRSR